MGKTSIAEFCLLYLVIIEEDRKKDPDVKKSNLKEERMYIFSFRHISSCLVEILSSMCDRHMELQRKVFVQSINLYVSRSVLKNVAT